MDRETLKQYVVLKKEVALLEQKIEGLREQAANVPTVMGKVSASGKEHPYTPQRISVEMAEPEAEARIKALIWLKEQRKAKSEQLIIDIEKFIADIQKPDLRVIFELVFQDGKSHEKAGEEVGLERSGVTKKINDYLELSHISQ